MNGKTLNVASFHHNLRLCIIENCIFIEETVSHVLGAILNIDWKESKSFGFSSSSLSFNQKVQIIMDIKGLDREELKKLTALMKIRNKFAHLSEIRTFDDLFSKTEVGKEIKKDLSKWYINKNEIIDIPQQNHEDLYRLYFYLLIHNVIEILIKISDEHMFELGFAKGKIDFTERLNHELLESLKLMDGGLEAICTILIKLKNEID